ncbi:SRPBCC family protein [Tropicibacter sp. R15_0]|uniref:SRPBCC family protein n=1 Tax=Tropicibacter sp. R15_0 TaxID=2821101 RepID=UPI001ADC6B11|nr:SRPBCC family protein [Tropicibacter sp. R15_0]MBO9465621.1 SRPBCC family protein [Tropicibacter sp. R15_0]
MSAKKLPGRYNLSTEIAVNAPADKVWEVLADFSAPDTYAEQVTLAYSLTPDLQGLGEKRHCDIKGFGSIQEEIIAWDAGRSLTYTVTPLGPLAASTSRWTVWPNGEGRSKITVELGYDLRFWPIGWIMHALFMRRALKKALPQGPEAVKTRVETGRSLRDRRAPHGQPQLKPALA